MIDWRGAIRDAEYRREEFQYEAEQLRRLGARADYDGSELPAEGGRAPLLGVLAAAMLTIIATGAITPR